MERKIVFATSNDGVRVACSVRGSGFPLLLLGQPLFSNCKLESPFEHPRRFADRIARNHTAINVDIRGDGLADRPTVHSFDGYLADINAIYEALDIKQADIFGGGLRSPVAVRFAARYPEKVRRLWTHSATVGPTAATGRAFVDRAGRNLVESDWQLFVERSPPGC